MWHLWWMAEKECAASVREHFVCQWHTTDETHDTRGAKSSAFCSPRSCAASAHHTSLSLFHLPFISSRTYYVALIVKLWVIPCTESSLITPTASPSCCSSVCSPASFWALLSLLQLMIHEVASMKGWRSWQDVNGSFLLSFQQKRSSSCVSFPCLPSLTQEEGQVGLVSGHYVESCTSFCHSHLYGRTTDEVGYVCLKLSVPLFSQPVSSVPM